MRASRVLGLLAVCACQREVADIDGAFYAWDHRAVHCALDIGAEARIDLASITSGLDRARDRGEVLELLVHIPGESLSWAAFEAVLAAVRDRGLPFLTYADLAAGPPRAGVALQYDDWYVQPWLASRALLAEYGAHVTIFVARYAHFLP